jgi:hypothetical protein
MRDFLGIGLRFPDQRLEPSLQILRRCGVKAVVDLTGVDQLFALLPGKIKAVPLRLSLRWRLRKVSFSSNS